MTTQTLEAFPELEFEGYGPELAGGGRFEHEGEFEDQEFWSSLAGLAQRAAASPALRRVGLAAARKAIDALPDLGASLGRPGSWQLPVREYEGEDEGEYEVNPIAKVYPAAVMEHLGRAAAEARDEVQAESFIGALAPLAIARASQSVPALLTATPQLIQGATGVTKALRRNPATRPLVRIMPAILRSAAVDLAKQASRGRPPSPPIVARTLANNTARTLTNPQRCLRAYQRSQALDRRYHQAIAR